jgi:hypothetical protein
MGDKQWAFRRGTTASGQLYTQLRVAGAQTLEFIV